jgi:UDP-N-acetylglucosamine--N-acetylmuramyl-(pentapeptide) pyrophosphoryl-undecaprenol N-acetylglucosamine transferase
VNLVIVGGHHSSALPILHKIKSENLNINVSWIGHRYSLAGDKNDTLEYREISALKIPFYDLKAGKIYKSVDLKNLIKLPFGLVQAFLYLLQIKPDVILSFGGYLAVPVVIAGWFLGIPSVTHEQTVVVGYANKFVSLFAKKILISWKESERYFPKDKTVYTGIPLRESIFISISNSFPSENNLPYVYITAGKTGSTKINDAVQKALPQLLTYCNVIHQCGDYSEHNSFDRLSAAYDQIRNEVPGKYYVRKFVLENEIGEAYFRAAVVVCRAGAHTVSELLAMEKPALLIPLGWVSHDEQNKNALVIKNSGLGEILDEADLNPTSLNEKVKYMVHNKNSYTSHNPSNFRTISKNAPDLILSEVVKYARQ